MAEPGAAAAAAPPPGNSSDVISPARKRELVNEVLNSVRLAEEVKIRFGDFNHREPLVKKCYRVNMNNIKSNQMGLDILMILHDFRPCKTFNSFGNGKLIIGFDDQKDALEVAALFHGREMVYYDENGDVKTSTVSCFFAEFARKAAQTAEEDKKVNEFGTRIGLVKKELTSHPHLYQQAISQEMSDLTLTELKNESAFE